MRTLRLSLAGTILATLLSGLPGVATGQEEVQRPGAVDEEPPTPAAFTATVLWEGTTPGRIEFGDGVIHHRDLIEDWVVAESSDRRFSGDVSWLVSRDSHDPPGVEVFNSVFRVENEEGAWQETSHPLLIAAGRGASGWSTFTSVLVGEGAYSGLTMVVEVEGLRNVTGVIFEGELPPLPAVGPSN